MSDKEKELIRSASTAAMFLSEFSRALVLGRSVEGLHVTLQDALHHFKDLVDLWEGFVADKALDQLTNDLKENLQEHEPTTKGS